MERRGVLARVCMERRGVLASETDIGLVRAVM